MILAQVPNLISLSRIPLTALALYCFYVDRIGIAVFLFGIASLSDMLDGYLARRFLLESEFGRLIDPITDKVMVLAGFTVLAWKEILPWWVVGVLALREVGLTLYRFAVLSKDNRVVPAFWWGKTKTGLQMFTLVLGFATLLSRIDSLVLLVRWLAYLSVLVSLYSGYRILVGRDGSD